MDIDDSRGSNLILRLTGFMDLQLFIYLTPETFLSWVKYNNKCKIASSFHNLWSDNMQHT